MPVEFFRTPFKVKKAELCDIKELAPRLPRLLPFYLKELSSYDDLRLQYMNAQQKEFLRSQVAYTRSLLKTQLSLKYDQKAEIDLDFCNDLFKQLDPTSFSPRIDSFESLNDSDEEGPDEASDDAYIEVHNKLVATPVSRLKYCTRYFSQALAELCHDFPKKAVNFHNDLKSYIGLVNGERLHCVWGGWFMSALMSRFTTVSYGDLPNALSAYSYGAGHSSYFLYFARVFFENLAVMRLVFKGPWMTGRERAYADRLSFTERGLEQLGNSKYWFINDYFWSIVNCLCFLKLTGSAWIPGSKLFTFGDVGNYLSAALFLMDALVAIGVLWEEENKYEAERFFLEAELEELENKKKSLKDLIRGSESISDLIIVEEEAVNDIGASQKELSIVEQNIQIQKKLMRQVDLDWKFQKKELTCTVFYSTALFFAFVLGCSVLLPQVVVAVSVAQACSLAGAILSFAFTVGAEAYKGHLSVKKSQEESRLIREDCEALLKEFNALLALEEKTEEDKLMLANLYLQMDGLINESLNKEKVSPTLQAQMAIKSIAQAIFPGLLIISFMHLAAGPAAGVVLSVMAALFVAYLITMYFEKYYVLDLPQDPQAIISTLTGDLDLDHFITRQELEDKPWYERDNFKALGASIQSSLCFALSMNMAPIIGLILVLGTLADKIVDAMSKDENELAADESQSMVY